jgi:membrane protease YdiL (CAAX protease family)
MNPEPGSQELPFDSSVNAADSAGLAEEPAACELPPADLMPRFCHRCGAAWDALANQCPVCAMAVPLATPVRGTSGVRLIKLALALYFAILGSTLAFALAGLSSGGMLLALEGLQTLMVLIWSAVLWRNLRPILATVSTTGFYAGAALLACMSFGVATLLLAVEVRLLGLPEIRLVEPLLSEGYGWGVIILLLSVQPAIIEEIAFRGVIFSAMEQVISPRDAVIVSGLLFMVIHLSYVSFPQLLLLGLVLGWLRMRTGSLYPGMVLHCVHNLLCVMMGHA